MAVVNYPESNNGIYLKHNSLDFLQKFRSPLSHWKILGLHGVILIIAEIFSLIFSDQFVFLRLGIIGTFVISFVVLGISIWPYRRYKIFETRGAKGKMVFIPTTDGTDYWLYKDDQLEVIQAGLLHI